MANPATRTPLLSVAEYLRLEATSPERHEYVAGRIYALAGTTRRHNRIAGNIYRLLAETAGDGPCRVSISDVRLRATRDVYYYPDVMVACGAEPEDPYLEEAPCLVVEVLSPSTESVDRREKLFLYRQIPSVQAYLIVEAERRRVERHWRGADGEWRAEELAEGAVPVPCPEAALPLDVIYAGVAFND
jgi:Uma2 family endonuclease